MPSLDIPTKGIEHFSPRRAQVFRAGQTLLQHRRSVPSDSPISPRVTMTPSQPIQPSASAASREAAASSTDPKAKPQPTQPIRILTQALSPYAPELTEEFFARLVPYFSKHSIEQGISLWNSRDVADAFYVLESGILRRSAPSSARTSLILCTQALYTTFPIRPKTLQNRCYPALSLAK